MATNLEAMNEWKRFFETRGKEVFDLLESAINYIALCHPEELFERRDQIAQLLFARQPESRGVNVDDDVFKEEDSTTNSSDFSDMALQMKEHRAEGHVIASKKSTRELKPDGDIVISDSEKCPASGIGMGTEDKEPKRGHIISIKLRPKANKEEQFPALEKAESQVAMEGLPTNTTHVEEQKSRALEKGNESETKCDAKVKQPVPHGVPKKSCTKATEVEIVSSKFSEKSRERKITEKTS